MWTRVKKTETCWLWTGPVNSTGYGSVIFDGHKTGAHRASYEMAYGPFDKRLCVLHQCDTPRCVRPDHLWLGTRGDNMRDCAAKGRNLTHYRWTRENHPHKGRILPDYIKEAVRRTKQRPFTVTTPDGTIIQGVNLTQFCRERALNQGAMWSVVNGRKPHHKGYTKAPES